MQCLDQVNRLQIPAEQESEGWRGRDGFETSLDFAAGASRVLSPGGRQPREAGELLRQHSRQLWASPSGLRATRGRARCHRELQNEKIQVFR